MVHPHGGSKNPAGGLAVIGLIWLAILLALSVLIFAGPLLAARSTCPAAVPGCAQQAAGGPAAQSLPSAAGRR